MTESIIAPDLLDTLCEIAGAQPPGAFVELGVFHGGSAARLYAVACAQGRTLHLFDTFTGHPVESVSDRDHPAHPPGKFAVPDDTLDNIRRAMPLAHVYPGIFPDTMPADMPPVAFVHCDLDLYLPTLAACRIFPALMPAGGAMLFDDTRVDDCPGVALAIREAFGHDGEALPDGRRIVRIPPQPVTP